LCWAQPAWLQAQSVDFLRDVQPVLTSKCLGCHSGANAQAELKLHTRADLLKGGLNGAAIVPGDADNSLLMRKIQGQQGMRMPPSGAPLAPETISLIRDWINTGARFDGVLGTVDRLAPMPPRSPALPPGPEAHPVDRFLNASLRERGISPAPLVPDAAFARRVYFDLIGLPPSPEQVRQFTHSSHSPKRDSLVDSLLAQREAYAEHWMSFWNDLLRNDEGVIYHGARKSITQWLYTALESNKPYDAMVRELLDPARNPQAEGYLTGVTWRGVVSASQTPPMQASQNAAQVFLGMNLKCAACHDSFVNRWKLADTFGLAAMFADEDLELVRCDIPTGRKAQARFPVDNLKVSFDGTLASRRQAAAAWFTHPDNGRFARTLVNRYWKLLLGRGLVEPIDDMDAEPFHQDLLDWLASDFAAHGFDLQHLLRRIVTSEAYQRASVEAPSKESHSTESQPKEAPFIFRGPTPRRLSAEQFQDAISTVTGDWRVNNPRSATFARYTREWRLKSDPLSRALGRPIRDQVFTERSPDSSTLQALELTNGPLLAKRLQTAARALLGQRQAAPANLFDSRMMRNGAVAVDVDIQGATGLWLFVEDVDSYDPDRVRVGWQNARLLGKGGSRPLAKPDTQVEVTGKPGGKPVPQPAIQAPLGQLLHFPLDGSQQRFQASAVIDERSRASDISPAVRFFVFTQEPDLTRLVRLEGQPPILPPQTTWTSNELARYLYGHLLGRAPSAAEEQLAIRILGGERPTLEGTEDLLWALLMSPEFQFLS
jgi:hypothetical protein